MGKLMRGLLVFVVTGNVSTCLDVSWIQDTVRDLNPCESDVVKRHTLRIPGSGMDCSVENWIK